MARSVYVALHDTDLICIGLAPLGDGPINVEIEFASESRATEGLDPGLSGRLASGTLELGGSFALAIRSGATWTPPLPPPFCASTTARGLSRLRAIAAQRLPAGGLAPIVLGEHRCELSSPLAKSAAASIAQLENGLVMALEDRLWPASALAGARQLVGLGPGLTPSGDDLVGGLLLALQAAGRSDLHGALWQAIEPCIGELTTVISCAFLRAVAEGFAARPLHDILVMLLQADEDRLGDGLSYVSAIGHTSGWDALSGLVLGLQCLTQHELDGKTETRAAWHA